MWTQTSTVPPGCAASPADADVLYLTCGEAMQAAQNSELFEKPVIIKETFLDSGMHAMLDSVRLLEDGLANFAHDGSTANLRNITHSHRPLITMLPRFRLLDCLAERLRLRASRTKIPKDVERDAKIPPEIRTDFNTLTHPSVSLGPSFATMSGVWMRNLEGAKLCSFTQLSRRDTDTELEILERSAKQKVFVLEQDDVLVIPPGSRISYALHSPVKGITEGGMFWDSFSVGNLLDSAEWIRKHGPKVASHFDRGIISRQQFRGLLGELKALVNIDPDMFGEGVIPQLLKQRLDETLARFEG